MITYKQLKACLRYNPRSGKFYWRVSQGTQRAGAQAGHKEIDGYIVIRIAKHNYRAHRLAYLYMTKRQPPRMLDHKNNVHNDNRWANLRPATDSQNQANGRLHADARVPFKGVAKRGKYKR